MPDPRYITALALINGVSINEIVEHCGTSTDRGLRYLRTIIFLDYVEPAVANGATRA